jgi:hypothetical protein
MKYREISMLAYYAQTNLKYREISMLLRTN